MRQAVALDPLAEMFGQAVADGLRHLGGRERVERADEVIERHARLGLGGDVLVQPLAGELIAEVMRQVVVEELVGVGLVAVETVQLAVGIVERRVEGGGDDERGELGDAVREVVHLREVVAGKEEPRFEFVGDVDGMPREARHAVGAGETTGDVLHAGESLVVGQFLGRPGPSVAERHRADALPLLAYTDSTTMVTFKIVTLSSATPPNLIGVR